MTDRVTGIEQSLPEDLALPMRAWPEADFVWRRSVARGAILGAVAGCVSLILNVVGSVAWPALGGIEQHPLRLIQVYLTFPLGDRALELHSGLLLAAGCVLYLATGAVYGSIFETVAEYFFPRAGLGGRMIVFTALAIVVWLVNFYGVLAWAQPVLLKGRWIVELVPWWVGMSTHLAFAWTMAVIHPRVEIRTK